jgi:hypothetical protein
MRSTGPSLPATLFWMKHLSFASALALVASIVGACSSDPVPVGQTVVDSGVVGTNDSGGPGSSDGSSPVDAGAVDAGDLDALATRFCAAVNGRRAKCNDAGAPETQADCLKTVTSYSCGFLPTVVQDYIACRGNLDCAAKSGDDFCLFEAALKKDAAKVNACGDFVSGCREAGTRVKGDLCVYPALQPMWSTSAAACFAGKTCEEAAACATAWSTTSGYNCK